MVDDDQLVGQVEDQLALVGGPLEPETDGLELEREVVAEGPVEAEVRFVGMVEEVDERPQHREHRGLPAALLLGEARRGGGHRHRDGARAGPDLGNGVESGEGAGDGGEEHLAPWVERLHVDPSAAPGQREGRIDEAHVPARVSPGELVAGGEQGAAMRVQRLDHGLDRALDGEALHVPMDADASAREVAVGRHAGVSSLRGAVSRGGQCGRSRPSRGGSLSISVSRACARQPGRPSRDRPPPHPYGRTGGATAYRGHERDADRSPAGCQAHGVELS